METNEVEKIVPKKKKKGLVKFITFLVIVGIIVVALGFIFPGLLWHKSLGVTYTSKDYDSVMEKLSYIKDVAPTGDSKDEYTYVYGSPVDVNVEFTSEELTAFFNENRPDYYALKNVQIKINDNGTIEAVATANVDYFLDEFLSGQYSREEINNEIPALGILPNNVNLYINFSGSVINNSTSARVDNVSVQGISIPSYLVNSSEAIGVVTSGCNNLMSIYNSNTGSSFNKIAIENGKIKFEGKVPSSLERIENQ